MSRFVILTIALLSMLLGALGMLAWTGGANPGPALTIDAAEDPATGDGPSLTALADFDAGLDGPAPEGGGDLDADVERRELSGRELAAIRRKGPELNVILPGRTRTPLAGAEVFWIEARDALERAASRFRFRDPAELAVRFGLSATTDASGRVQLPTVRERLLVAARHPDGWFGVRTFVVDRHRESEHLVVERDATLRVRVVASDDPGRVVAGVPVALFERVVQQRGNRPTFHRIARLTSGDDGHATLEHVQLYRNRGRGGGAPDTELAVALHVPLAEPQVERFPSTAVPTDVIVLRLPAVGALQVRLQSFGGAPFTNGANVRLQIEGRASEPEGLGAGFDALEGSAKFGESTIDFPMVGLGLRLMPSVRLEDREFAWEDEPFAGPARSDELIEHPIGLPDWIGILRGRLVDDTGASLGSVRPTFLLSGRAGRVEGERLQVDADGRFDLPFHVRRGDPQPPFDLEVRLEDDVTPLGATVSLRTVQVGTITALGDVTMSPLDLLARGRVVDERGVAVAGARVRMQSLRDVGDSASGTFQWRDQAFVDARSIEDGSFVVRGDPPLGTSFRLRVEARGHSQTDTEPLPIGASVDVVLRRTAELRGQILAPEWLDFGMLTVRLLPRDPQASRRETSVNGRNGRGDYRLRSVVPGFYDLIVAVRGMPRPPLRILGVRVSPEPDELDPRIAELDLRGLLYRYRLRAVAAGSGEVIGDPGAPLLVRTDGYVGANSFTGYPWRRGIVEMVHEHPRLEILQLGVGFAPREHFVVAGDTDLAFERLQPIELIVRGARAAAGQGRRVRVSAVLRSETGVPNGMSVIDPRSGEPRRYNRAQLGKSAGAWLPDDGDRVSMPISRPGDYYVVLRLTVPGREQPVACVVGEITVRVGVTESSRHEIAVDPAVVAKALAAPQ